MAFIQRPSLITLGTLAADESVVIAPEIAGRVIFLGFKEGERVKAGQELVKLDTAILDAELKQAMADLGVTGLLELPPAGTLTGIAKRNLKGVECKPADAVGVADVIGAARLVLTPGAADHLTRIARKDREEATA